MERDKTYWLDSLGQDGIRLLEISGILSKYSDSFYIVGNNKIGKLLYIISEELETISKNIDRATGKIVSDLLHTSQENSANVLKACLAGIEIATKDKQDK